MILYSLEIKKFEFSKQLADAKNFKLKKIKMITFLIIAEKNKFD